MGLVLYLKPHTLSMRPFGWCVTIEWSILMDLVLFPKPPTLSMRPGTPILSEFKHLGVHLQYSEAV